MTKLPPKLIEPWLNYRQSLTAKLKAETGSAELKIINEAWVANNSAWFSDKSSFQREILMYSSEQACWYARTLIPESTYNQHLALFLRLKNEPLGQIIFTNPLIKRESLEFYPINESSQEYYWLKPELRSPEHWCRQSKFTIENSAFYLIEIFLSGLFLCLEEAQSA